MALKKITLTTFLHRGFLSLIALTLTACLPIPHFQPEAPALEGTVKRNGTFAANIEVFLFVNQSVPLGCNGARAQTRTDAGGKFRFEQTKYFTPVFMYGDRGDGWSLCFKFSNKTEATWNDHDWWGGPPLQRFECLINNGEKPVGRIELESLKKANIVFPDPVEQDQLLAGRKFDLKNLPRQNLPRPTVNRYESKNYCRVEEVR